jgi:hypothetical protein
MIKNLIKSVKIKKKENNFEAGNRSKKFSQDVNFLNETNSYKKEIEEIIKV